MADRKSSVSRRGLVMVVGLWAGKFTVKFTIPSGSQVAVESPCDQAFICLPYIAGYFLGDLETFGRVDPDPLQVTHHNMDHFFQGDLFRRVVFKRDPGGSDDQFLIRPMFFEGSI